MDEIEKFLREAAARRSQQKKRQARPQQPDVQYVDPQIIEAEAISDSDLSSVASRHIDSSRKFDQRSAHMGERAKLADDLMEQHLHEKFDHGVGRLGEASSEIATDSDDLALSRPRDAQASQLARSLLEMLRTPQSLRSAILLREILEPPEQRWK